MLVPLALFNPALTGRAKGVARLRRLEEKSRRDARATKWGKRRRYEMGRAEARPYKGEKNGSKDPPLQGRAELACGEVFEGLEAAKQLGAG